MYVLFIIEYTNANISPQLTVVY